ncbi:hypothetical protein RRV45_19445 [Bacillus sp. DTU_2020_1000418_1_SI_GHA_SEK_038]|uniref:hypothetical protein n=1 Tax=Bacillus sp. DTU_2020_1000418_1_SI_GHA_SEK_038 TaxID=3077585 RepID=UPI0028EE5E88|nr:hypothetical protein [Bacillus sp. DTU_2020_1000418_1_SI_GHA_SEK_038]WNS75030.1 hypothetical protein RRV45_19445 [Bacillus sp. DTU_2020_1000418_1_SI_GHA_SEK_038]
MISLHDKSSLDQINWASKKDGAYVRDYFSPILRDGVEKYITNVRADVYLLEIDDLVMPVTVNDKEFDNSYVCSPYTHYISYAKEELWELKKPRLEKFLSKGLDFIGFVFWQTAINKIVSVNNWFLSTNLYFPLSHSQIDRITQFLIGRFPHHTIQFRSIVKGLYPGMFEAFERNSYERIMSRSVYLLQPYYFRELSNRRRRDFFRDKKFMEQSSYTVIEGKDVTEALIPIIKSHYEQLYIDKYSKHNPQFTWHYFKNILDHRLMHFKLLKQIANHVDFDTSQENTYDGVIGYFHRDGVLTTPIFGYEMDKGQANGLYRLLSYLITDEVLEKNFVGHFSAGAGNFKRNRGAVQEIEYTFFYNKHLPLKSRWIWTFLKRLMDWVVVPMARKMKF